MYFFPNIDVIKKHCMQSIYTVLLTFQRRRRDSNPRAPEGKRISSAPRYDHFDTSPDIFLWISTAFLLYQTSSEKKRLKLRFLDKRDEVPASSPSDHSFIYPARPADSSPGTST